jgi:hypothetical protein
MYPWVFLVVSFPQFSHQNPICAPSVPTHATFAAHLILLELMTPIYYLLSCTVRSSPDYVVFSTPLLRRPS